MPAGAKRNEAVFAAWQYERQAAEKAHKCRPLQEGWGEFLCRQEYKLDVFFTLTFSDDYAKEHFVYSPVSALNVFERWIAAMDFPGNYYVAAEPHWERDVPHLHGLLSSSGLRRKTLWADWFREKGRAKFEEPRSDAAFLYAAKYAAKRDAAEWPDSWRLRLVPLGRAHRRLTAGCGSRTMFQEGGARGVVADPEG